jgi:quinol monooxygenase YgiN
MNYSISYLEVEIAARAQAAEIIASQAQTVCLQEINRTNRFVAMSRKEMEGPPPYAQELKYLLISPLDEREHEVLEVDEFADFSDELFVVTHIDVIPPEKDNGNALVRQMCLDSRKQDGCLACNALAQINRPNHMTVFENWLDREAQSTHAETDTIKTFREALTPLSGALYDERFYRLVN